MITPNYIKLYQSGELQARVEQALKSLGSCQVCPWKCQINRLEDERKVCKIGRYARVSSYFPHFGEEDCLRGWNGSGTIFFGWCNLRCVFCQNFDISQKEAGNLVTPEQLSSMMILLQAQGCHNINWVTPEHVVPQILEALPHAIKAGLRLPIVYNTSSYDSMESLRQMEGIVDIYMPDFKYWDQNKSKKYLKSEDYPEVTRQVLKEMHRQVGDLVVDEKGIAQKGLIIRHLVMPGELEDTRKILEFIATEISPDSFVDIMGQYYPTGKVNEKKYSEINRKLWPQELKEAYTIARELGLSRFEERWLTSV